MNNNNLDLVKGKFTMSLQTIAGYLQQYRNSILNRDEQTTSNKGVYERFEDCHVKMNADIEKIAEEFDFISNFKGEVSIICNSGHLTDSQKINLIKSFLK